MFLPNNTRIVKVMSVMEEGEEWMVEQRVITEIVYWDMVGCSVLTVIEISSLKSQMVMLVYLQSRVVALVILVALLLLFLWAATTVIQLSSSRYDF